MDSSVPTDHVAKRAKTDPVAWTDEVAWVLFLRIHKMDKDVIDKHGFVPRRIYTASHKSYISLREKVAEAKVRAQELFDSKCAIDEETFLLLRIQFTHKGLSHYATTSSTSVVPPGTPFLYKLAYPNDKVKDWGAWAFHADLPLKHINDNGDVLLECEWQ